MAKTEECWVLIGCVVCKEDITPSKVVALNYCTSAERPVRVCFLPSDDMPMSQCCLDHT